MAEINNNNIDYVRFYLKSDLFGKIKMEASPKGWSDDLPQLKRSINHGIFNQFTNTLYFYKKDRDFIEDTFKSLGNNASLYLIKENLESDENGEIYFQEVYRGRADWETKKIIKGVLQVKFNSEDIEEKLKANETDEFEIETTKSIDDIDIGEIQSYLTSLKGRNLTFSGKSILDFSSQPPGGAYFNKFWFTPITKLLVQGDDRHSSVDVYEASVIDSDDYGLNNGQSNAAGFAIFDKGAVASNMMIVDTVSEQSTSFIRIKYKIKARASVPNWNRTFRIGFVYKKKNEGDGYTTIGSDTLFEETIEFGQTREIDLEGFVDVVAPFDVGVCLVYKWFTSTLNENVENFYSYSAKVTQQDISIEGYTYEDPSLDLKFYFLHDVFKRLSQIILNKNNLFYSKVFARTELGYEKDGEFGLIGLMSGFQARGFNSDSERYKSPTFSWKKLLQSCNSVFAVGMGIESINNNKRIRIEKIKFFYQNKVVVKLGQVSNVERGYQKDLYFSGIEIGYNKGGDYENEIGLDEPNTLSKFVTPDRKSKNKYEKISDLRSDEYGLEKTRRKPEFLYPNEDTNGDNHNWLLDLKRAQDKFEQREWEDRLESEPIGINNPETYRSFLFTPLRMLFRHGWIIRSGLQAELENKIKFISSKANSNLETHFIGENESFLEEIPNGLKVKKLERSRFLPEPVKFEYAVDRELIRKIYGSTRVLYEGSYEYVPNYYFKFEYINEKQEIERGYLMDFKPEKMAKFEMLLANENII